MSEQQQARSDDVHDLAMGMPNATVATPPCSSDSPGSPIRTHGLLPLDRCSGADAARPGAHPPGSRERSSSVAAVTFDVMPLHDDIGRTRTARRGITPDALTVGWNLPEAGVSIAAGIAAGSVALTGFGLGSGLEAFAAAAALCLRPALGGFGRRVCRRHLRSSRGTRGIDSRALLRVTASSP